MDILVISLSSPLLVGVYEDNLLIKEYKSYSQTTDILPQIFDEICKKFTIKTIFYTNGPGSFMAIKASYIFLKTLAISKNIELFASDGFHFNQNSPIKAVGNKWFVKDKDSIILKEDQAPYVKEFALPKVLDRTIFSKNSEPLYILPAV